VENAVFYIFLVIAILLIVGIPWALMHDQRVRDNWRQAAETLGLRFYGTHLFQPRQIDGTRNGFSVRIHTFTRRSGENSTTYTQIRLAYPRPLGLGLKLTREGFFSGLTKLLGAQDIEVGDGEFDRMALVKGRNSESIAAFLTPARRLRIHRLLQNYPEVQILDDAITLTRHGVISRAHVLVTTVQAMERVAWHLTGERREDEAMTAAMAAQDDGRPEEALRILRESQARGTLPDASHFEGPLPRDFVDEQFLEGEILDIAGRHEEAAERFALVRERAPDDQELELWAERTASGTRDSSAPRTPPAEAPLPLDAAGFCQVVFAEHTSSFAANEFFELDYAGKMISWSGPLRRVERISFDMVWGEQEACKATVEIHASSDSGYWSSPVKAFVQLPPEMAPALRDRVGQEISFTGRLFRLDAFMRNVYVTDATLHTP
jgi:hypothetical protein